MPEKTVRTAAARVRNAIWSRLRSRWPSIVAAVGVTLFAWPLYRQPANDGIDPSWQFSLHQAFHDRTSFDELVFTRGPLGFLNAPHLWFFDTWALAVVVNVFVALALAYAVLRLLGLRLGFVWSVVIAVPLVLVFNVVVFQDGRLLPEVCVLVGVLVAAVATTRFARPSQRWLLVGLVALVAFVLFKDGFVRHDAHSVQFFGFFALLPLAFLPAWTPRQALALVIAPVVALLGIANVDLIALVAPGSRIDEIADVAHLARSQSERRRLIEGHGQNLREL